MRLGIFGGTFDPIHLGHLRLAEEAREQIRLDRVLFVPNNVSPFKTGRTVTPGQVRLEMVQRAVADNPHFGASAVEVERAGPSYTIDTVRALRGEYGPDADLFLITGADAVRDLPAWREPDALLALLAGIATAARPGTDRQAVLGALPAPWAARVTFIAMPALDISATDVRARAANGRSIRYLVPAPVAALIDAHGWYRAAAGVPDATALRAPRKETAA
jgi:nicotinate-nucleotide adenylyltransferase